mmetsp:Transcript_4130/g.4796  ORF Transcript_4130/g.4796 Transcript_4130/m.4796 type:complete len:99 (-) Transcript_4130:6542-6838(-)
MSTWTDGWEDNDVEFEDDESSIEEDFDKKEDSQGLKLGSGMFMGRLANLVNSVADENQANGEGKKKTRGRIRAQSHNYVPYNIDIIIVPGCRGGRWLG